MLSLIGSRAAAETPLTNVVVAQAILQAFKLSDRFSPTESTNTVYYQSTRVLYFFFWVHHDLKEVDQSVYSVTECGAGTFWQQEFF